MSLKFLPITLSFIKDGTVCIVCFRSISPEADLKTKTLPGARHSPSKCISSHMTFAEPAVCSWADEDDSAYLVRSVENSFLGITKLTPDYLDIDGGICSQTAFQVCKLMSRQRPPHSGSCIAPAVHQVAPHCQ